MVRRSGILCNARFSTSCMFLLAIASAAVFGSGRTGPSDGEIAAMVDAVKAADHPGQDTVVVLDRTDVDVADTGLSRMAFFHIVKVLTPEGATSEMTRTFDYDPKSSDVRVAGIRVWRDGKAGDVDLSGVADIPAPAAAIYWGNRGKVVQLPRLKAGDAVEVRYERKGFVLALLGGEVEGGDERFIPPMRGQFFDIVPFYSTRPVMEKTYTVRVGRGKPLQFKFFNGEAEVETRMDGDSLVYRWTQRKIAPLKKESQMPSPDDVAPKLIVTTTATWNDKSAWFYRVNEDYGSFAVTPEVREKVRELLSGVGGDDAKIAALTHWVADNIRYSGISMGKGEGYTLHTGEMTFRDRCGVCKDKAGMLVTMLRAAGYESHPAMTMAGSRIEDIPSDQFNHCVTLVKRADGRYQLLDPTWVPASRELWSSLEQEQQYLMGVPETAGLMTTEYSDPSLHVLSYRSEVAVGPDGDATVDLSIESEGQGDAAIRRNLMRNPRCRMDAYFQGAMGILHPGAAVTKLEYVNPDDLSRPMTVRLTANLPRYAQVSGSRMWFSSPALAQFLADGATAPFLNFKVDKAERKFPFVGRCTGIYRWAETVRLPEGFRVAAPPAEVRITGDAADYSRKVGVEGGVMKIDQELVLKKRVFPAAWYENLKKATDAMLAERKRVFAAEKEVLQ